MQQHKPFYKWLPPEISYITQHHIHLKPFYKCYFNSEIRSWNHHIHGRAAYITQHLQSRFQLMLQPFPFVLTFSRQSVWYLVADFLMLFAGAYFICWFHLIRPDNLYLTILGGLMFMESMWTILHLRFRFTNTTGPGQQFYFCAPLTVFTGWS